MNLLEVTKFSQYKGVRSLINFLHVIAIILCLGCAVFVLIYGMFLSSKDFLHSSHIIWAAILLPTVLGLYISWKLTVVIFDVSDGILMILAQTKSQNEAITAIGAQIQGQLNTLCHQSQSTNSYLDRLCEAE